MRFTTSVLAIVVSAGFMSAAHAQQQHITGNTTSGGNSSVSRGYGTTEFRLGPEDVIEVSVYQDKELSATVPVRPDGKISLHIIGEIPASGKTATELQKEITQKYASIIANPAVTVMVKEVNSPKVSVGGEVKTPGMYKIGVGATILDVLAMAGGITEYAKKDNVMVIRVDANGREDHIKINLDDQIKGRRAGPFYVLPYDKIYVR
jgi:polysaccharide export outer membrane protein